MKYHKDYFIYIDDFVNNNTIRNRFKLKTIRKEKIQIEI